MRQPTLKFLWTPFDNTIVNYNNVPIGTRVEKLMYEQRGKME